MGKGPTTTLATEMEIRNGVKDIRAALTEGPIRPNIWGFYSNKNRSLLTLVGDVTFIQAVLLEGDPTVAAYSVVADSYENENTYGYGRDLLVSYTDGAKHWYLCGRYENLIKHPSAGLRQRIGETQRRAIKVDAEFQLRTERDLAARMQEFRNWLTLCAAMTRARDFSQEKEFSALYDQLQRNKSCSFDGAIRLSNVDPAAMIATIAKGIAGGLIQCNLQRQPLNAETEINLGAPRLHMDVTRPTLDPTREKLTQKNLVPPNRRTARVPETWRDLSRWPAPNIEELTDSESYRRNKKAVEMYVAGRPFEAIRVATGLHEDWVRELLRKCLNVHRDGQIMGFRGLVKYLRKPGYERRAPLPGPNIHEAGTSGYAGALFQLFQRFPEQLPAIIETYVLSLREHLVLQLPEARIRWVDLKDNVLSFLREQGVQDSEYPFNTRDQAYSALAEVARSILFRRPIKFIQSRSGKEAGRLAQLGNGVPPLIQAFGPYQILELDFHKHDSAATVEIETPTEGVIDALVPRFWIGCAVDVFNRAILATSDSFEKQTTESCVLDLIDAAISPPEPLEQLREYKGCEDGYWQLNQIYPQYAWHAWDIIKMDRAWAHRSTGVISKLISTTGCAVCFGRPKTWWARSIIERTFRELTSRGAQRLPTTYGSGPSDPSRRSPEQQAVSLKLRRSEICNLAKSLVREINKTAREGAFWESAEESLARTHTISTYLPRPLPLPRRIDRPTLWVTLEPKVEADTKRGIAPHVRVQGVRYRGVELANAWGLVGQTVILEISRNDIRAARLTNPLTGEIIGPVQPDKRWLPYRLTWQNFLMIQKYGRLKRTHTRPASVTAHFLKTRQSELMKKGAGAISSAKVAASDIDKLNADIKSDTSISSGTANTSNSTKIAAEEKYSEENQPLDLDRLLGIAPRIGSFSRK